MKEKPSYWGIIISEVLHSTVLTSDEKILFTHISTLQQKEGYCYASNKYFADAMNTTRETASRRISKLEKLGFIKTLIFYKDDQKTIDYRKITLLIPPSIPIDSSVNTPLDATSNTPIDAGIKDNNTRVNNTSKNKKNIQKRSTDQIVKALVIPNSEVDIFLIQSFIRHREETGYPFTQTALSHFVQKLEVLKRQNENIEEMIETAIISGWRNIFPNKKPWVSAQEAKRDKGEEMQKILNENGYDNIFDLIEEINQAELTA